MQQMQIIKNTLNSASEKNTVSVIKFLMNETNK